MEEQFQVQFINRFEQFGKVSFDLVFIKDGEIRHRFNITIDAEDENQDTLDAISEEKSQFVAIENRTAYVNQKMDIVKSRLSAVVDAELEAIRAEILGELYGRFN
jgi:hypothetical protein